MATPTIVLLHGQPGFAASLWKLRGALRARLGGDVEFVVADRPGYGANPLRAGDFIDNAEWLEELLQRRADGPVVLLGHSWGGGVALLTAARKRIPVAALVLLASVGPDCLLPADHLLAGPVVGEVAAFTSMRLVRPMVIGPTARRLQAALEPLERRYFGTSQLAMIRRDIWRSFLFEQRALVSQLPLLDAALGNIDAPTLVLAGTADRMIPPATSRALASHIRGAKLHQLPAAGHDLHVRRAAEVAEHVTLFLR